MVSIIQPASGAASKEDALKPAQVALFITVAAAPLLLCAILAIPSLGVKGSVAWLLPTALFYCVFWAGLLLPKARRALRGISLVDWAAALVVFGLLCAVIVFVLGQERWIFSWDEGSYWYRTLDVGNGLAAHPKQTLIDSWDSINTKTYNNLAPLFTAAPLRVFGGGYAAFAALVTVCFDLPAAVCATVTVRVLQGENAHRKLPLWLSCVVFAAYSALVLPQIRGYNDAAASLMAFVAFMAVACCPEDKVDFRAAAVLGASMLLTFLVRRYFANWGVGFVAGLLLYCVLAPLAYESGKRKAFFTYVKTFAVAGVGAGLVGVLCFGRLLARAVFGDYAFAYQAYDSGRSVAEKALVLFQVPGIVTCVLLLAALAYVLASRRFRSFGALIVVTCIVACLMFWRIQDLGVQHYLILAPEVYLLLLLGLAGIWESRFLSGRAAQAALSVLLCAWSCMGVAHYSGAVEYSDGYGAVFGKAHHVIRVRDDLDQLKRMAESFSDEDLIWVSASSRLMNESLLENCFKELDPCDATVVGDNIDERDGFRVKFFDANKVVVCDPPQTHKAPEHQRVVVELVPLLLDSSSSVGKHYKQVGEYALDNGITAYVLERQSDYSASDIRDLEAVFDQCYSEYPALFHDRFEQYIEEHSLL